MKTAIYIEEGVTQIVLTPENEFEEKIVKEAEGKATLLRGGFYKCNGGWDRHSMDDTSLIVRLERQPQNMPDPGNIR